ncbi:MAG: tyrosine-type recombinase/integrase [Victivallales bacterium]
MDLARKNEKEIRANLQREIYYSSFANYIASYIELHRSLGKKYQKEKNVLRHFDAFMFSYSNSTKINGLAFDAWCQTLAHALLPDRRNRMRIIRNFCIYRHRMQPDAFIPDINIFPRICQAKRAFILSQDNVANLLYATRKLTPSSNGPLRPEVMRIAILLLYTCGLRRGELLNLRLADYNHSEATLFIRATQFHKQRIIPLSETVGKELHDYLCYCCQKGVKMDSNSPLICSYPSNEKKWQPYTGTGLHGNWRYLCAGLGILTPQGTA